MTTATKPTFRLISDVIQVDRVLLGEVLPTDIVVGWADIAPNTLPTLTIHQRWLKKLGRWGETTSYSVAEIAVGNGFDGRGFHLVKLTTNDDGDSVPTDENYDVFVARSGQDICDCKGHTFARYCKHVDALRFVIDQGLMELAADDETQRAVDLAEWNDAVTPQDDPFAGVDLTMPEIVFPVQRLTQLEGE